MSPTPADAAEQARWLLLGLGTVTALNLALGLVWAFRRLVLAKPTFARTWSLLDAWLGVQLVLALLVALLAAGALVLYAAAALFRFRVPADIFDLRLLLPATILQGVVFFAVPAAFIAIRYRQRLRDIGLPPLPRPRDWWAGVLLGLAAVVVFQVLGLALTGAANQFRHVEWVARALEYEKNNPVAQVIRALPGQSPAMLLLAVLGIGVSAGLGEEMLFRGFLFNILKRRFGLAAGLVVSGLLFAAPHTYVLGLLPVFLMGLVLAWIYHNSGSLWVPVIVHATNNSVLVLLAYFFPALST